MMPMSSMSKEKAKLRDLKLKFYSLQASYEDLNTSHENLKETHEKLEEVHNTLLADENKAILSVGVSCDLIGEKCCGSTFTNLSCSSSDLSSLSDESCDKSLLLESELLKKKVVFLTNDLRKCYDKRAQFNHYWANRKFTIKGQGFGYIPKKGRAAFVQTNTTFVKNSGIPFLLELHKCGS
jgi:hypothetical protein